jgi:DnaJ-class molecular chaperone
MITLCKVCDGTGKTESYENDLGESIININKCSRCNGTGRVLEYSFHMNVPYGTDIQKISNVSGRILTLIREFEKEIKSNN